MQNREGDWGRALHLCLLSLLKGDEIVAYVANVSDLTFPLETRSEPFMCASHLTIASFEGNEQLSYQSFLFSRFSG